MLNEIIIFDDDNGYMTIMWGGNDDPEINVEWHLLPYNTIPQVVKLEWRGSMRICRTWPTRRFRQCAL